MFTKGLVGPDTAKGPEVNVGARGMTDQGGGFFTLLFSHLADAFIQSDLQIRKSN